MIRKKLKITLECEGQETKTFEANGIASVLLTDGKDSDHHGLQVLICGNMSIQDLAHLYDGVEEELTKALAQAIMSEMSPEDIVKILMGGKKHGADR
jgi:hypothetical protein